MRDGFKALCNISKFSHNSFGAPINTYFCKETRATLTDTASKKYAQFVNNLRFSFHNQQLSNKCILRSSICLQK